MKKFNIKINRAKNLLDTSVSGAFLKRNITSLAKFIFLSGVSFLILFPLIVKLSSVFMSREDLYDQTVMYIPRNPTFYNIRLVYEMMEYNRTALNTFTISLLCAILQVIAALIIGYGLARFNFRGRGILLFIIVLTIIIPPQIIYIPFFMKFRFFDIFGIIGSLFGNTIRLTDTVFPFIILSITGLGFKNGLYIFVMRQLFKGIPEELEEAAYIDGAGVFRTFYKIMTPCAIPMMVTIFLLSFSWQWTDSFYSSLFLVNYKVLSMVALNVSFNPVEQIIAATQMGSLMLNTAALFIILPLLVIYLFAQKLFIQGIERSGIVG